MHQDDEAFTSHTLFCQTLTKYFLSFGFGYFILSSFKLQSNFGSICQCYSRLMDFILFISNKLSDLTFISDKYFNTEKLIVRVSLNSHTPIESYQKPWIDLIINGLSIFGASSDLQVSTKE